MKKRRLKSVEISTIIWNLAFYKARAEANSRNLHCISSLIWDQTIERIERSIVGDVNQIRNRVDQTWDQIESILK